jgi:hypothetical protein
MMLSKAPPPQVPLLDENGFIRRGGHRVSLRKLSERPLTAKDISSVMHQNFIEMAMLDPPLVEADGDAVKITEAGQHALSGYQSSDQRKR